jgi:hypothetical protein
MIVLIKHTIYFYISDPTAFGLGFDAPEQGSGRLLYSERGAAAAHAGL